MPDVLNSFMNLEFTLSLSLLRDVSAFDILLFVKHLTYREKYNVFGRCQRWTDKFGFLLDTI